MPKERPSGGKKIRATNEMRNFSEVLGLHDYRIFISRKWIYHLAFISREWKRIQNGTAIREIPMKEEYGLSMLLISGFLQGCAIKHESGHWSLRRWLLSCGGICKQNCTANQGMVFLLIGQPATDQKKHFSSCRTTETGNGGVPLFPVVWIVR